jgi:Ca2+-binding RTX toxin-like protein
MTSCVRILSYRAVAASLAISLGAVVGISSTALAGETTCTFDPASGILTVEVSPGDQQVVFRRQGDQIEEATADCGSATRFNVDKIKVIDAPANNVTVFIRMDNNGGGPFKPGLTNEPGSSDEIEFLFRLGDGSNSTNIKGQDTNDHFRAGNSFSGPSVNLNANESTGVDRDVVIKGALSDLTFEGFDGNDRISGKGGRRTGGTSIVRIWMNGLAGADRLIGGRNGDNGDGGIGPDIVSLGKGVDEFYGKAGDDVLRGGASNDLLYGGLHDDHLDGGAGNQDLCYDDSGTNTFVDCELFS